MAEGARPAREARVVPPHRRRLRPLQDAHRAADLAAVVLLDGRAEEAGARGDAQRARARSIRSRSTASRSSRSRTRPTGTSRARSGGAISCRCGSARTATSPSRRRSRTACAECGSTELTRSTDVLDTWFSSALWPFATLGWPDDTEDLRTFYPGDLNTTARDIIRLWENRMIFSGLELMGDVPFRDVVIHSLVHAPAGGRMSKSLGTGMNPLALIEAYGADATRYGLMKMASAQDVRFSEGAIEEGRKLANKLWNVVAADPARVRGRGARRAPADARGALDPRAALADAARGRAAARRVRLLAPRRRALPPHLRRLLRLVRGVDQAAPLRRRRRRARDRRRRARAPAQAAASGDAARHGGDLDGAARAQDAADRRARGRRRATTRRADALDERAGGCAAMFRRSGVLPKRLDEERQRIFDAVVRPGAAEGERQRRGRARAAAQGDRARREDARERALRRQRARRRSWRPSARSSRGTAVSSTRSRTDELEAVAYEFWRAPEVEELDGWRLRFAHGITGRANSVWPNGDGTLPLDEKIERAEAWYRERGRADAVPADGCRATRRARGGARRARLRSCAARRSPSRSRRSTTCSRGRAARPRSATAARRRVARALGRLARLREPRRGARDAHARATPRSRRIGGEAVGRGVVDRLVARDHVDGDGAGRAPPRPRARDRARARALGVGAAAARTRCCRSRARTTPARTLYASAGFVPHHEYHYRKLSMTATEWVASLSPWPEEFGLGRMHALLDALGNPQRAYRSRARRRHERQVDGDAHDRRAAARGRPRGRRVHVAARERLARAARHGRRLVRARGRARAGSRRGRRRDAVRDAHGGGVRALRRARASTQPSSRPGSAAGSTRRTSSTRPSSC